MRVRTRDMRRENIKCIFCFGSGKVLCRKALFSIGKFGFFRQKIQYCNLCYGNGNISIEVLLDLQVDCRTFH